MVTEKEKEKDNQKDSAAKDQQTNEKTNDKVVNQVYQAKKFFVGVGNNGPVVKSVLK